MTPTTITTPIDVESYLAILDEVRKHTYQLTSPLSEAAITTQHSPLMSPVAWDLGHVANFEELWFLQNLRGRKPINPDYNQIYDAFTQPRNRRHTLPLPSLQDCYAYMKDVRQRVKDSLIQASLDYSDPLLKDGFLFEMLIRHEMQHQETMLITLQIMEQGLYSPPFDSSLPESDTNSANKEMRYIPGGKFTMGWQHDSFAYDNEKPAHPREVESFLIDPYPVTNGEFLDFIVNDGYKRREFWSDAGWQWRQESDIGSPMYWRERDGDWFLRRFDEILPVNPREPVMHVSWYEAEAYSNFAGKRLPTEAEWEYAASWNPDTGAKLSYPWGDDVMNDNANLNQRTFRPAETGAYPGSASPCGVHQMIGDVWEWTSGNFEAYPGFRAFPYDEYSKVFFGDDYQVLRGGAWATHDRVITNTFRNWDYPIRRQIFAGFRCAKDVE